MNLGKEFVRAAVRQVGRDGGKVISNKIYKGQHGTPIYNSGQASVGNSSKVVDVSDIDMSIQPPVKGGGIVPVLKGLGFQFFPVFGHLAVLIKVLSYLGKKKTKVFATLPNRVVDRRYKEGYRIDGYSLVKTNTVRYLQDEEKKKVRNRGISYLLSILIGGALYALIFSSSLISENLVQYGYVEKGKINIRQEASTNSDIVLQVLQGDSVKIIEFKGPLETFNGETANWMKIEYGDESGWIWGGLLTIKE